MANMPTERAGLSQKGFFLSLLLALVFALGGAFKEIAKDQVVTPIGDWLRKMFGPLLPHIVEAIMSHLLAYGAALALGVLLFWFGYRRGKVVTESPAIDETHQNTQKGRWISIKEAVDYIKDESNWRPSAEGRAWSEDLDRCMRAIFARAFGPAVRGRKYPVGINVSDFAPPPLKRIPRSFWKRARFDVDELRMTPARITAAGQRWFYADIDVERAPILRAFPPKRLPKVPPKAPIGATNAQMDPLLRAVDAFHDTARNYAEREAIIGRLAHQYRILIESVDAQAALDGQPHFESRLEVARLINKQIAQYAPAYTGPNGALLLEKGWNTFVVIFPSVMRSSPEITFINLPEGVHGELMQKTPLAFSVKFWPDSIRVTQFEFEASTEL